MKSDLHIELSRRALTWLESRATNRGIRGADEVLLDDGYVADAAEICGLVLAIEQRMVPNCSRRFSEKITDDYAFVFESKVSRADFFNTFKRSNHRGDRLQPIGNFHYAVTPKAMVTPEDVPTFWGLLEKSGAGLSVKKPATHQPLEPQRLHYFAYMVLRASHETKFCIHGDMIEQYRADQQITIDHLLDL